MPELPEVETIRAQLAPRLEGRTLARVEILDPRLTRPVDLFEVVEELEGDRVTSVERRGKYLLVRLESGFALLVHLRMTGSFGFAPTSHERAVLELDDGSRLAYRDVRRFGTWLVLEDAELEPYLARKNGVEPLGSRFTARWLAAKLAARRAPLKAVLLDQRVVAGLGNIYADEALWRARVNPLRPANELSGEESRPPHPGDPGRAQGGHRAPGLDATGLRRSRRGVRIHAGRVPRLRARRTALLPVPRHDHENPCRRAWDVVLSALPARRADAMIRARLRFRTASAAT